LRLAGGFLLSGLLAIAAPNRPSPGAVNYVEGQVTLDGRQIDNGSIGNAVIEAGGVLATSDGKAEILLTPGVFLRVGDQSTVRVLNPGLADTVISLDRGQATIEADYWPNDTRIKVQQNMVTTTIDKKGFYVLNAESPYVEVMKGKATVVMNDKSISAGEGDEIAMLPSGKLKKLDFNGKALNDITLVRWSRLRSQYEAQANLDAARTVVINHGWYGPGWYWGPQWGFWSYLPGDGIFYNPWGFGFYSPFYLSYYGGPYIYGRGFYGRGFVGRAFAAPAVRGGFSGGFGGFARGGRR
jgi:hypothetical protein